jgi:hypothetical protein
MDIRYKFKIASVLNIFDRMEVSYTHKLTTRSPNINKISEN